MFTFVAFDQGQEFVFTGRFGMPGKGTAAQRNWNAGRSVERRLPPLLPL